QLCLPHPVGTAHDQARARGIAGACRRRRVPVRADDAPLRIGVHHLLPHLIMAKVELRDVRKSYGDLEVIHGVTTSVADGEFIVIVGPSGCGKSTLLRMVAGLEQITSGDIVIGERVVNTLEPKDRDIAMVFQNYALYPHMSVFDNMAYGLRIRGFSKDDIKARVDRAAA